MKRETKGAYKQITKNEAIGARVTAKLKKELQKEADNIGVSLSEYICIIIEEHRNERRNR